MGIYLRRCRGSSYYTKLHVAENRVNGPCIERSFEALAVIAHALFGLQKALSNKVDGLVGSNGVFLVLGNIRIPWLELGFVFRTS